MLIFNYYCCIFLDEDQEEDDTALNCGNGGDADDSGRWYTAESGGEIRLSAEGRANLERVVGNLNDIPGK